MSAILALKPVDLEAAGLELNWLIAVDVPEGMNKGFQYAVS